MGTGNLSTECFRVPRMCIFPSVIYCSIGHSPYLPVHSASVSVAQASPLLINCGKQYWDVQGGGGQYNHPIYNGRPLDLHGPPIEIYDETLAKLKDDLRDPSGAPEPSTHYIVQTADMFHAFGTLYDTEPLPREDFLGPA